MAEFRNLKEPAPAVARQHAGNGLVIACAFSPNEIELTAMAAVIAQPPRDPKYRVDWESAGRAKVRIDAVDHERLLNGLTFELLSDYNKDAVQKYDVANPDMLGLKNISKRAVVVVDKDGVIRHREVTASPGDEPNYQKIHDVLATLR